MLGIFGLVGSGRSELLRTVFGVDPATGGQVLVAGKQLRLHSVADAIRAGLGMVPEDRKRQGLLGTMTVRENVSLAALGRVTRVGIVEKSKDRQMSRRFQHELQIHPDNIEISAASLSGGNQQKVMIARWLATDPKVLMLDEPTAGVDVGAKTEVHRLVRTTAEDGAAVVLVSSDVREVLTIADRVMVMHEGKVAGILPIESASDERLVALASGIAAAEQSN